MTKRQCLTCGYYQAGPTKGVGWCIHPKRKESIDIKLLVRGGELPCRNDWDHDLWTDALTFTGQTDLVLTNVVGPLAPVSIDDVVFLTSSQRDVADSGASGASGGSAVDLVIREESAMPQGPASRGAIRGSVRRAHQVVQAEKRTERFADGAGPALDGGFSAPPMEPPPQKAPLDERVYESKADAPPAVEFTPTRPAFTPVPPVQPGERNRVDPKIAIYPSDDHRFTSVPLREASVPLPTTFKAADGEVVIRSSYSEDDVALDAWPARPAGPGPNDASRERPNPAGSVPSHREEPADVAAAASFEDVLIEDITAPEYFVSPYADDFEPIPEPKRSRTRGGLFRSRRRPVVEPIDDDDELWDEIPAVQPIERAIETLASVYVQTDPRPEPLVATPALIADVDGRVAFAEPIRTALWANVPRMCRTCREFRPAETGDRGWCSNEWAFKHRRMVDADERPCDSSVGCWWLPTDDVWLASSDISAHGQPTPLLNAWLEQRLVREFGHEPAPFRRRQRG